MSDVRITDPNHHLNHLDFGPVLAYIPKNTTLLDVGCGHGTWLKYLRIHRPDVKAVGVDPNPEYVDYCRKNGLDVWYDDIYTIPEDRQYDIVTCFHILEHIAEDREGLRRLVHVSKFAVILVLPRWCLTQEKWRLAWDWHYQVVYTPLALKRLLKYYNAAVYEHYAPTGTYESWMVIIKR